jgi:hypothetical protein
MKHIATILAAGTVLAFTAAAATSQTTAPQTTAQGKVEIVQKDAKGRATQVRIDGKVYAVCMSDDQDSCINPRSAGLNFGNYELKSWPGRPASERDLPRQASL